MANQVSVHDFTAAQLATIKATVARDTDNREFDLFMEVCRAKGLNPFLKQIHALVFNKDKADKRNMSIIVSRDGLRVLAQRCQDYRPASEPATIVYDEAAKGPTNPKGIVSASVRLWKRDQSGEWFPVIGEADWDEFAPLKEIWTPDANNTRRPSGKFELDRTGNWAKMPKVMITKCAECQALRAGWPDEFHGVYAAEEMQRAEADATASEALEAFEREQRQARLGGPSLMFVLGDEGNLEPIRIGRVFDRLDGHIQQSTPEQVATFEQRNGASLKAFWAHDKAAALELKKRIEEKTAGLDKPVAA